MKKAVPRVYDPSDAFQREARNAIKDIANISLVSGVLLSDVSIATTATRVSHGLGRVPKGWFVVDRTADARVYRDSTGTERKTFLTLKASAACTVSLWIF